ncbi:MAG: FecR domain-containing protein [Oceanospirillaceae bacterium]|nr:FecR domain-containing protein [Oceanospirillaceae bacterium]
MFLMMRQLSVLFVCLLCLNDSHATEISVGNVVATVGEVFAQRGNLVQPLMRGADVQAGDELASGPASRLVVRFNDGSILTLGADTRMQVRDWQYREKSSANKAQLSLVAGAFRLVTGAITRQQKPDLNVQTPMGAIGVRGTDFWGGYLDADAVDVILLEGEHKLEISNGAGHVLISTPGEGVTLRPNAAPTQPVKWSAEKLQRAVQTISMP